MKLSEFLKEVCGLEADIPIHYEGKEALEAVKQDWHALMHVKDQTDEICLEAVKQNGDALAYVDISIFEDEDDDIIISNGVKYKKIEE